MSDEESVVWTVTRVPAEDPVCVRVLPGHGVTYRNSYVHVYPLNSEGEEEEDTQEEEDEDEIIEVLDTPVSSPILISDDSEDEFSIDLPGVEDFQFSPPTYNILDEILAGYDADDESEI